MNENRPNRDDVDRMWQEAEVYEKQGLYDHAVMLYKNILTKRPDDRKAQAKVVQIQFNQQIGETTEVRNSLDNNKLSPRLALDLGIAYMGMSLYLEALDEFKKALAPSPVFRNEILKYTATCLIYMSKYEEAEAITNQLLQDKSLSLTERGDFFTEIACAYVKVGAYAIAQNFLSEAPDEVKSYITDYETILDKLASANAGRTVKVLVEDPETGRSYSGRIDVSSPASEADDQTSRSDSTDNDDPVELDLPVKYSIDSKTWHDGMARQISTSFALVDFSEFKPEPGDSVVLQIQLPDFENNERVWVVTRIAKKSFFRTQDKSPEVKTEFVSFLPGGENLLRQFIKKIRIDSSLLNDESTGTDISGLQVESTNVFEQLEAEAIKLFGSGLIGDIPPTQLKEVQVPEERSDPDSDEIAIEAEPDQRLRFACECGQIHSVPVRSVGKKGKCGNCGRTMRVPVVDLRQDSLSKLLVGKIVGGCRLLYKLGGGGMGGVFKGHHIALDIPVAVKILHAHLAEKDPVFVKRFIREARAAAKLQHPNVVGVMNVGFEEGLHFLVMPFITGGSAAVMLAKQGRFRVEKVIHIAIDISKALIVAEDQKTLHRDIKPANILFNERGDAMLADLGLAKNYLDSQDSGITQTGIACGTPLYFSPEQAKGSPNMDIRSDIYSLGITLYHLLDGSPPFKGESAYVIFQKHVHEPLPPFQGISPPIPDDIFKLILKMTAKNPNDRYSSARELLKALEQLRDELLRSGKKQIKEKKQSLWSRLGIKR